MPSTARKNDKVNACKSKQPGILAFKCPVCGGDTIAEVWHGVFKSIRIGGLIPGEGALFRGVTHDNGMAEFGGYYCATCSFALVNPDGKRIMSEKELLSFLEMLSEDHETAEKYRCLRQVDSSGPAPKYCPDCGSQFDRID